MPFHSLRIHPFAADYHQHHHAHHQIVIGFQGLARMDIGEHTTRMDVSTGCILPAGTSHGFQGLGDNRLLVIDIPTDLSLLQSGTPGIPRLFDVPRIFAVDTGLAHYVAFLCHESTRNDTITMLVTLLGALAARLMPAREPQRLDLLRLNAFIDARLDQPIRVPELAALFHLSSAHFTALFRHQCNTSPYRYVQARRMHAARQLVVDTKLSIDHIAARTHFADQSALTHAFRRHFGTTPRQLRRTSLTPA